MKPPPPFTFRSVFNEEFGCRELWEEIRDQARGDDLYIDHLRRSQNDPQKRLKECLRYLPMPDAFAQAMIACRASVRVTMKAGQAPHDLLQRLYCMAALSSLVDGDSVHKEELEELMISEREAKWFIPSSSWENIPIDYSKLGFEKLGLAKTTDVKWWTTAWGTPSAHQTLREIYPGIWDDAYRGLVKSAYLKDRGADPVGGQREIEEWADRRKQLHAEHAFQYQQDLRRRNEIREKAEAHMRANPAEFLQGYRKGLARFGFTEEQIEDAVRGWRIEKSIDPPSSANPQNISAPTPPAFTFRDIFGREFGNADYIEEWRTLRGSGTGERIAPADRANYSKRLELALPYLPKEQAFSAALTACRMAIRACQKEETDKHLWIARLYCLNALTNLPPDRSIYSDELRHLLLAEWHARWHIPISTWETLPIDYRTLGYSELCLSPSEIKWITDAWGEPRSHGTLHDQYPHVWREAVTSLLKFEYEKWRDDPLFSRIETDRSFDAWINFRLEVRRDFDEGNRQDGIESKPAASRLSLPTPPAPADSTSSSRLGLWFALFTTAFALLGAGYYFSRV